MFPEKPHINLNFGQFEIKENFSYFPHLYSGSKVNMGLFKKLNISSFVFCLMVKRQSEIPEEDKVDIITQSLFG